MADEKKDVTVLTDVEVTGVSVIPEDQMVSPGQRIIKLSQSKMVEDGIEAMLIPPEPRPISPSVPTRIRLADERLSATHKFTFVGGEKTVVFDGGKVIEKLADVEGYITAGAYPDGRLGEVFLTLGKEGAHWKAFECLMIAVSVGLQHGIPLSVFVDKFEHTRFEPSGLTKNPDIPLSKSVAHYIFQWLKMRFPDGVNDALAAAWKKAQEDVGNGLGGCNEEDEGGGGRPGGGEAVPLCSDGTRDNREASDGSGGSLSDE